MAQDVQVFFQSLDQDEDGLISAQDIYTAIKSQGWAGTYAQVQKVFSKMDLNGDGVLTFEEMNQTFENLLQLVSSKLEDNENDSTNTFIKETNNDMKPDTIENTNYSMPSNNSQTNLQLTISHEPFSSTSLSSSSLEYKEEYTQTATKGNIKSPFLKDQHSQQKADVDHSNSEGQSLGEGQIMTLEEMEGMKGIPPSWVSDESVARCMGRTCRKSFTLFNRRHHCRHCGGVFCHYCTERSISISKFGYHAPVRVCEPCHLLITKELSNDDFPIKKKNKHSQDFVRGPALVSLPFSYTQASTEQIVEKT